MYISLADLSLQSRNRHPQILRAPVFFDFFENKQKPMDFLFSKWYNIHCYYTALEIKFKRKEALNP
jgi:hypothetical protein